MIHCKENKQNHDISQVLLSQSPRIYEQATEQLPVLLDTTQKLTQWCLCPTDAYHNNGRPTNNEFA